MKKLSSSITLWDPLGVNISDVFIVYLLVLKIGKHCQQSLACCHLIITRKLSTELKKPKLE